MRTGESTVTFPLDDDDFDYCNNVSRSPDHFPCGIDFPWQQQQQHVDDHDDAALIGNDDPFASIMLMPSQDNDDFGTEQREFSFVSRLDVLHGIMRENVLAAPETEQPSMVNLIASWARTVANDPLATLFLNNRIASGEVNGRDDDERYYSFHSDHHAAADDSDTSPMRATDV